MAKINTSASRFEKFRASMSSDGVVGGKLITAKDDDHNHGTLDYDKVEIICDEALLNATANNINPWFSDRLKAIGSHAFGPGLEEISLEGPVPQIDPHAFDAVRRGFKVDVPEKYFVDYTTLASQMKWNIKVTSFEMKTNAERQSRETAAEMLREHKKAVHEEFDAEKKRRKEAKFDAEIEITLSGDRGPVCWIEGLHWEYPFVYCDRNADMTITFRPKDYGRRAAQFSITPRILSIAVEPNKLPLTVDENNPLAIPEHKDWRIWGNALPYYAEALERAINTPDGYKPQYALLASLIYDRWVGRPKDKNLPPKTDALHSRICMLRRGDKLRITFPAIKVDGEEFFNSADLHLFAFNAAQLDGNYKQAIALTPGINRKGEGSHSLFGIIDMLGYGKKFLCMNSFSVISADGKKQVLTEFDDELLFSVVTRRDYLAEAGSWFDDRGAAIAEVRGSQEAKRHENEEYEEDMKFLWQEQERVFGRGYHSKSVDEQQRIFARYLDDLSRGRLRPDQIIRNRHDAKPDAKPEPKPVTPPPTPKPAPAPAKVAAVSTTEVDPKDIADAVVAAATVVKLPLKESAMNSYESYLSQRGHWTARMHNDAAPELDAVVEMSTLTMKYALKKSAMPRYRAWRGKGESVIYLTNKIIVLKGDTNSIRTCAEIAGSAMASFLGATADPAKDTYDKKTLIRFFIYDTDGTLTVRDTLFDGSRIVTDLAPSYFDGLIAGDRNAKAKCENLANNPL